MSVEGFGNLCHIGDVHSVSLSTNAKPWDLLNLDLVTSLFVVDGERSLNYLLHILLVVSFVK